MKILSTVPFSGDFLKGILKDRVPGSDFTVEDAHCFTEEELSKAVASADIILGDYTFKTQITHRVVAAGKQLKLIQQPSAGFNNIDVHACREFNVPVANTPGANDIGVAEHTIMLALACLKKLTYVNSKTHQGEWVFDQRQALGIFEIRGRTYGLIGMGQTARSVAECLIPFGVKLLYYDLLQLNPEDEKKYQATYAPLDEILKNADIISLHLPLTPETQGVINAAKLSIMKPTSFLINVGRGPLVDEKALAEALQNKKIAGAAMDVFCQEPPQKNYPLFEMENVILTPHLAGSTAESELRIMDMALTNIARVIKGEEPFWTLN